MCVCVTVQREVSGYANIIYCIVRPTRTLISKLNGIELYIKKKLTT